MGVINTTTNKVSTYKQTKPDTASNSRLIDLLSCEKCGSTDIHTRYHRNSHACGYSERFDDGCSDEHLHRYCRGCGYTWASPILSAR